MSMAVSTSSREDFAVTAATSCVGVVNAGSSSIKFALYEAGHDGPLLLRGQVEGIGADPRLKIEDAAGSVVRRQQWAKSEMDHRVAMTEILSFGRRWSAGGPLIGIGHRVVHGGTQFAAPALIDREVMAALQKLVPLAPLHQPHNLVPIAIIAAARPDLPQVACFDTAFHRSQPRLAQEFALPRDITTAGVRRYGFHGLSFEFVLSRLAEIDPALTDSRLIIAHLGNGASLCAISGGRSVASTMGFTAVEGLMMGTRCGSIDPGVLLFLMEERGLDAKAIEDLLYRRSGLLGVSGISPDMRTLRESSAPEAREAIDLFVYRIVWEIGSLAATLGGIDGLVFTAGIGENDPLTRAEVASGCSWLGLKIDPALNAGGRGRINATGSAVSVWVIPTDEQRMIARHMHAALAAESLGETS
jgi:acetate kinase